MGTIEAGTGLWYAPNAGATNESGFSAFPGGFRFGPGGFSSLGYGAYFRSSTEYGSNYEWFRGLSSGYAYVYRTNYAKSEGFSVRCIKDL